MILQGITSTATVTLAQREGVPLPRQRIGAGYPRVRVSQLQAASFRERSVTKGPLVWVGVSAVLGAVCAAFVGTFSLWVVVTLVLACARLYGLCPEALWAWWQSDASATACLRVMIPLGACVGGWCGRYHPTWCMP